jgi:hypothetical protein
MRFNGTSFLYCSKIAVCRNPKGYIADPGSLHLDLRGQPVIIKELRSASK